MITCICAHILLARLSLPIPKIIICVVQTRLAYPRLYRQYHQGTSYIIIHCPQGIKIFFVYYRKKIITFGSKLEMK